jgi:hypothetical protein
VEEAFMMSLRRVLVAALAVLQRYLRLLVGLIVAVLTFYFLARAVEGLRLQDVWARLPRPTTGGSCRGWASTSWRWPRAPWRWHYLLRRSRIPLRELFPRVVIGYMGNNIYPARAGEVLRSYVLRRRDGVPISSSLATVLIERIFDGVVMLLFVFVALPAMPNLSDTVRGTVVLGSLAFFGALIAFLALAARPAAAARLAGWFTTRLVPARFHDQVATLVERFLHGLASLRRPQTC